MFISLVYDTIDYLQNSAAHNILFMPYAKVTKALKIQAKTQRYCACGKPKHLKKCTKSKVVQFT